MAVKKSRARKGSSQVKASLTEPLWTVQDVASYLRLKQETIRMMARAHKIPAMKVGKVWRFKPSDIQERLKASVAR